jgi:hypothetical protein
MNMAVSEKWKKITIVAVIAIVILGVLIGLLVGLKGLKDFFKWLMVVLLGALLIGVIIYAVWRIFFAKEYKDIPAQYRKKLHAVTKVMKNDMLGDLYLSGDYKHNKINMGKYFYLRINLPKIVRKEGQDRTDKNTQTEPVPVDCFVVQKRGFINRLFSDPFFILVKPQDHNYSAIFNDVTINGFNLVPLDSEFFTIDRRNLDLDMVQGLSMNYIREVVYEVFKDLDRMVKQAINLDQQFQKDKEKSREFEIPSMSGALQK